MKQKVCFIIGAGCTVADALSLPKKERPPLDKGFFLLSNKTNPVSVSKIKSYIEENYGLDILYVENDSLESVMAKIYTDIFNPDLKGKATDVFRTLISLFNRRLADTTNRLPATKMRYLYRMICHYLYTGVDPEDITIITFNQDIQIEKILHKLEQTQRYSESGRIFNFPFCYNVDFVATTFPKNSGNIFKEGKPDLIGIKLLKLHGSLNWYSTHRTTRVSPVAMFNPIRPIRVTCRQTINPQMRHARRGGALSTLPVIVPPVTHKSGILHDRIRPLWTKAKGALQKANEVVIFGYSCPAMDFESSNLIQRSLRSGVYEVLWVIDPDPNVLTRYIELIKPDQITYYPSARDYLERRR